MGYIQERVGTKGQTLFFVPNQISNNIPEKRRRSVYYYEVYNNDDSKISGKGNAQTDG